MNQVCDYTSVGILVWYEDKLLLLERKNFPFGFAPPAGHLDGDTYPEAAKRELKEEVGLDVINLKLLVEEKVENRCKRKEGDWHHWKVYEAEVRGKIERSVEETKQVGWYTKSEIEELANKTEQYLQGKITKIEWGKTPGIEPVWYNFFKKLTII